MLDSNLILKNKKRLFIVYFFPFKKKKINEDQIIISEYNQIYNLSKFKEKQVQVVKVSKKFSKMMGKIMLLNVKKYFMVII